MTEFLSLVQAFLAPLYEALFALSVGFLTIVPAIYALVVTMLGPSLMVARTAGIRLRRSLSEDIKSLQARMANSQINDNTLRELETQVKIRRKELRYAERGNKSLDLWSAVLAPGSMFLLTGLLSTIPMAGVRSDDTPSIYWSVLFVGFGTGVALLIRVLLRILAIIDISLPDLRIEVDPDPVPWKVGSQNRIRLKAILEKGNSLAHTQLVLFIPPACTYLADPIWIVPLDDSLMPGGYKAISSSRWDYKAFAPYNWEFHNLIPGQPGRMKFFYAVYGPEFTTEPKPIEIETV